MDISATELRAGPLRCRFADGELRYLKVGNVELVRRIYFAVRTKTWDTLAPTFPRLGCEIGEDRFRIRFDAVCERGMKGYDSDGAFRWSGEIVGEPDGQIRFRASGAPTRDFEGNRVGLCVLFGTPDVCGTEYELVADSGRTREGRFPRLVNAPLTFEEKFLRLRSRRGSGKGVLVGLDGDGIFSMEDQRNFADTSFKAYATLPYAYPNLRAGQGFTQTVTLTPEGFPAFRYEDGDISFVLPGDGPTGRVPRLRVGSRGERNWFNAVNADRAKTRTQPEVAFACFPVEHLLDDDTCWENIPCVVELAATARAIAPGKPVDVRYVAITPSHPHPDTDPRNAGPFGAAWAAAFVGYASLAGVRTASFDFGPGAATEMVQRLRAWEGRPVRALRVSSPALVPPVHGFTFGADTVLVNQTDEVQRVTHGNRGLWLEPYEVRFLK